MTKPRKGSRVTPKGTQDPNRRQMRVVSANPQSLDAFVREFGFRPAALPGSGNCMACGKKLVPPPEGPDKDHAVCHACFPEDMREEWEGRQVDYTRVDLDAGTVEEIPMPEDHFP